MIRVRFETKVIAPAFLPAFVYTASVLAHSTIQYTALIPSDSPVSVTDPANTACEAVVAHWPDAVVISAEANVDSFQEQDLKLTGYVFGTYKRGPDPEPGLLYRVWHSLVGAPARRLDVGRKADQPYAHAPA